MEENDSMMTDPFNDPTEFQLCEIRRVLLAGQWLTVHAGSFDLGSFIDSRVQGFAFTLPGGGRMRGPVSAIQAVDIGTTNA